MSLVIFFGFAAFIFILGLIVIVATFYGWKKEAELAKAELAKTNALKFKTTEITTET